MTSRRTPTTHCVPTAQRALAAAPDRSAEPARAERASRAAWVREVVGALSHLDDFDRHALRLIYFGELTQAQVAHELAVPLETVREHVARGMIQLAAYLSGGAPERPAQLAPRR